MPFPFLLEDSKTYDWTDARRILNGSALVDPYSIIVASSESGFGANESHLIIFKVCLCENEYFAVTEDDDLVKCTINRSS